MKIVLNDSEIRNALAEEISKKLDHSIVDIEPSECWFEVKAGVINGEDVDDIHHVEFHYNSDS